MNKERETDPDVRKQKGASAFTRTYNQVLLHCDLPVLLFQLKRGGHCTRVHTSIVQSKPFKFCSTYPTVHTEEGRVSAKFWVPTVDMIKEQVQVLGLKIAGRVCVCVCVCMCVYVFVCVCVCVCVCVLADTLTGLILIQFCSAGVYYLLL